MTAIPPEGLPAGFLTLPPGGKGPLVIVFPAWWGLNDFFKQVCRMLAAAGFVTLGLDYYQEGIAQTITEAQQLSRALDKDIVRRAARHWVSLLRERGVIEGEGIGALGFSMGAGLAVHLARDLPEQVEAVVLFYGAPGGDFEALQASFQGHFAETDHWGAGAGRVESLRRHLVDAGLEAQLFVYPGTEHWFFEPDRPEAFDAEAAALAWKRTLEFLREHLT